MTNKYSPDGSLLKHKARFVCRGYNQRPGVDFKETFAPVARQRSIRIMAALSAKFGLEIHQFDVTTAYLNGTLEEEIFMECPDYFGEVLEKIIVSEKPNCEISIKASEMLKSINEGNKVLKEISLRFKTGR